MRKRNKKWVWISVIMVVIFGILYFSPLIDRIGLTSPKLCGDVSYDYKCVCGSGQVKTGRFPWKCADLPPVPNEVTFPIETWGEARAYTQSILGGFPCTGSYAYNNPLNGEIYKQCDKYGSVMTEYGRNYLGHMIMMECRSVETVNQEGQPTSGYIVFSVLFDPNDGHIYEISCKDDMIPCPETQFENNYKKDSSAICGDTTETDRFGFCCHKGETFENCPLDCE